MDRGDDTGADPGHEFTAVDARRLVDAISQLAQMAGRLLPAQAPPLTIKLRDHLGVAEQVPNTSATFDPIEQANLQLALDALHATAAGWDEIGLSSELSHYGGVSLTAFVAGTFHGPGESARQLVSVQVSKEETITCLVSGIVLTEFDGVPVAAMVHTSEHRGPQRSLVFEVVAATQQAADAFLARVTSLMTELNVLRGKVLSFAFSEYGGFGLAFAGLPAVTRDQVVLPAWQLDAIDEHAIGITELRDQLVAAGQHLRRGLLLYGPPGTGKTHTVAYLVGRMPDRTTILLGGASVGALGQAASLARKLAPATIVIEDVDLIGMDRGLPGGEHNPMLFQLLNEMDGLAPTDDVLFVLTTNRADLLEPALAARPGRVDQALEIGVPDAAGRRALFELYLGEPVDAATLADAVDRTSGVAAAFVKELARRATLRRIRHGGEPGAALAHVVHEMVRTATPLLRSTLGAGGDSIRRSTDT
ncbi:MAG: ATP-binding protein [Ilumatobacteraceae bacterium]